MPDQAGLILGQIPYFKEQKLQLNALVCPGGMGGGGGVFGRFKDYVMYHSSPLGTSDLVSKQYFFRAFFFHTDSKKSDFICK